MGGRRATFPRSPAVSSPRRGLTSLFGMGRGAPPRHGRRSSFSRHFRDGRKKPRAAHKQSQDSGRVPARGHPRWLRRRARLISGAAASFRAISAARLNASPRSHLRPIHVVVSHGPQRRPHLGAGFALRCPQRLSRPDAATRLRAWRRDRHTVGPSDPVLSY